MTSGSKNGEGAISANKNASQLDLLIRAMNFAAKFHRQQRRKDQEATPYINHPIEVAHFLASIGKIDDPDVLIAAVLHDTIEDTECKKEDIAKEFGEKVLSLVLECTDDKSLPKQERKRLQIVNAPHKSPSAACIKLADKTSNVKALTKSPPADWSLERQHEYLEWTEKVVAGLRGHNAELERFYDSALKEAKHTLLKI
ncbi:MAG: HD domain-containing protein [Candidatus Obscuribacterales bacterium]|nr:HD domain-containing protein [Candidatus Obscuribacterales bacterium]